jgi:hypothetical protein
LHRTTMVRVNWRPSNDVAWARSVPYTQILRQK